MADSYETSRVLGFKLLEMITEELEDDDFFACGLAALDMAKTALLEFPGFTELEAEKAPPVVLAWPKPS